MLGFNFHVASPRYIDPPGCKRLIDELRRERAQLPLLVGVFVNLLPAEIDIILEACGLDLAQLSGDEGPEVVLKLRGARSRPSGPAICLMPGDLRAFITPACIAATCPRCCSTLQDRASTAAAVIRPIGRSVGRSQERCLSYWPEGCDPITCPKPSQRYTPGASMSLRGWSERPESRIPTEWPPLSGSRRNRPLQLD